MIISSIIIIIPNNGVKSNFFKKRFPDLDYNKTEKELTSELGYDKIWDCGLFKYRLEL